MSRPFRLRWFGYRTTDEISPRHHVSTFRTAEARDAAEQRLRAYDLIVDVAGSDGEG